MVEEEKTEEMNAMQTGQEGQTQEEQLRPLYARMKKSYPDNPFEKDDDYLDMAEKHIAGLEDKVSKFDMSNKKIMSILDDNPELKGVFADLAQGVPFAVALARNIDIEAVIPLEGEDGYEDYAKENEARKAKIKANQEFISQRDKNLEASVAEIEAFAEEANMDETKAGEFLNWISQLMGRLTDGSFDKQLLSDLYKSYKHDEIVNEETQLAEIRGKNAKIDEMIQETNGSNDGLPFVEGSNTEIASNDGSTDTILDDAIISDRKRRSVYEEGRRAV